MKIITSSGIEYGIVFVDSLSGNIVFYPTHAIIVAGSSESGVTTDSNANDVQDQSGAEIDRLKREEAGEGEYADDYDPNANQQQQQTTQQPASGVAASTDGYEARGWQPSASDAPSARGWKTADTTITKVIVALSERGDEAVSIIALTVRGEHVIWIEENKATHERAVKCSPIYYKNDAVKVMEQIFGEDEGTDENLNQVEQNQLAQNQQFQENQAQQQAAQQQAQQQAGQSQQQAGQSQQQAGQSQQQAGQSQQQQQQANQTQAQPQAEQTNQGQTQAGQTIPQTQQVSELTATPQVQDPSMVMQQG